MPAVADRHRDVSTLRRQPIHRRQLSDVTLLPRREHAREHTFAPGRNGNAPRGRRRHHRRPPPRPRLARRRPRPHRAAALRRHALPPRRPQDHAALRRAHLRRASRTKAPSPASPPPSPPVAIRRRPGRSSTASRPSPSPGPGPIVRGLRTSAIQDSGHPDEEHVFLWFLTVHPEHQRAGIGRQLLARVVEEAEAPVYLDTANPANLPYYASAGFEEIGRAALPRGATMWFMRRP